MSVYSDLLFLQGHIADPRLARELATAQASTPDPAASAEIAPRITYQPAARGTAADATLASNTANIHSAWRDPMTLFKSLLYLGGLESIDSRIGEEEESFGPTYGNRVASERKFGKPAPDAFHRRVVPVAHGPAAPLGCVAGSCG